jgi:hypothetical protein
MLFWPSVSSTMTLLFASLSLSLRAAWPSATPIAVPSSSLLRRTHCTAASRWSTPPLSSVSGHSVRGQAAKVIRPMRSLRRALTKSATTALTTSSVVSPRSSPWSSIEDEVSTASMMSMPSV